MVAPAAPFLFIIIIKNKKKSLVILLILNLVLVSLCKKDRSRIGKAVCEFCTRQDCCDKLSSEFNYERKTGSDVKK